ncbi:helix-turn-helix domain containing protein [Streptomyces noursei]|uniref:helix-turn-helix domain-containing protein n=1 Tax=Streptomyces noursei TaxID=1971 RepID=UPI0022CC620F|nr:helix-turn-helix domain containing protein [Streptomyces noursei]
MGVGGWLYSWSVRYVDGSRLSPGGRQRRETVRMQAAELFQQMVKPSEVARRLRVSVKSAYQWHQLWRDGGVQALASRGPSGSRGAFPQGRVVGVFPLVARGFGVG